MCGHRVFIGGSVFAQIWQIFDDLKWMREFYLTVTVRQWNLRLTHDDDGHGVVSNISV